jgi:hypothetical protein
VESLKNYISNKPREDRDLLLRGKKLKKSDEDELQKFPFRNMFIEERDLEIASLVFNYFDAVRERWPEAWEFRGRGLMLNKTNGFRALMRVFRPIYLYLAAPGDPVESKRFLEILRRIELTDQDFTVENFPPGTSGEAALTQDFLEQLGFKRTG